MIYHTHTHTLTELTMEDAVVLYPLPGMGHLISMVELAKLVLTHHPNSFSITVLILSPPPSSGDQVSQKISDYISAVTATVPAISFHRLPPPAGQLRPGLFPPELFFELARVNNPAVKEALVEISAKSRLKAFVVDFFCDAAFEEVSSKLGVPTYFFFTSGASALAFLLHLPKLHDETEESFGDMGDRFLDVPGIRSDSLRASDVAPVHRCRSSELHLRFLRMCANLAASSGIAVNTFEALENRALHALSEKKTPPVFAVGPVISSGNEKDETHSCLEWLDGQAEGSVVFLCFGSMGAFPSSQIREIAAALERSGWGFLWVVRDPPGDSIGGALPEGFVERTKEVGRVVERWAPQARVLAHPTVGGFVTHCGWNSVLEAVIAGVPMLAWPLYAEQTFNAALMVGEMGVAVGRVACDAETGFVSSAELENRVGELMDLEKGREVREKVRALRDCAAGSGSGSGSSKAALAKLTEKWKGNC